MSSRIREQIKSAFPFLKYAWWRIKPSYRKSMVKKFTEIYQNNAWSDPESVSGGGSNLQSTTTIREVLPGIFDEFNIRTILDIPCGDFFWQKEMDLSRFDYIGIDIVPQIIEANHKYATPGIRFRTGDITSDDLPASDITMCRDCLVHFSFADIFAALANIKRSGTRFLLTTTFPHFKKNEDIVTGWWRHLNFQMPPFNFPDPERMIDEKKVTPEGKLIYKNLGLWRMTSLDI